MNGNGLLQGFQAGYGMMDNYYNNKDRREFRDKQYADQQSYLSEQQARQKEADERAKQSHNIGLQGQQLQNVVLAKQVANYDETKGLATKQAESAIAANNARTQASGLTTKFNQTKLDEAELQKKWMNVANMVEAHKSGMKVDFDALFNQAKGLEGTQYDFLFNGIKQETIDMLYSDLNSGQVSQRTLQLMNNGGIPEIKAAIGKPSRYGSPIVDVVMRDIKPLVGKDKGKFGVTLLVRDKEGNTYESVVNENRDADSPIKEIDMDKVLQHISAQKFILDEARTSGFMEQLQQHRSVMPQQQESNTPAKVQEYEYIRQLVGDDALKSFIVNGRGKSAQEIQSDAQNLAIKMIQNDVSLMNATQEEQQQALVNATQFLMQMHQQNQAVPNQQQSGQLTPEQERAMQNFEKVFGSQQ